MAITTRKISELYLAYLGRPEDAWGALLYGGPQTIAPAKLVNDFAVAPESLALVATASLSAQVEQVYQRLFNRSAEPAGQAYWQAEVTSGRLDVRQLPLAILQGAQNADAIAVANKLAVAEAFFEHMDTVVEKTQYSGDAAAAAARDFLHQVTGDPATLLVALADIDVAVSGAVAVGQPPGVRFFLTTAADLIDTVHPANVTNNGFGLSTNAGDEFVAGEILSQPTIGNGDTIDGGGGTDTLVVTVDQDVSTAGDTITSVERVQVTIGGTGTLDLSGVRDLQHVTAIGNSSVPGTLTLHGITLADALSLQLQEGTGVVLDYADPVLPATMTFRFPDFAGNLTVPRVQHAVIDLGNSPGQWHRLGTWTLPDASTVLVTGSQFVAGVGGGVSLGVVTAPGGTLTMDSDGTDNLHLSAASTLVVNGTGSMFALLESSVKTAELNSSGPGLTLRPVAGPVDDPDPFVATNHGTGKVQIDGGQSARPVIATGGPVTDAFFGSRFADVFTGGGGDDDFVFQNTTGILPAAGLVSVMDTITDFGPGDRLRNGGNFGFASHAGLAPGIAAIDNGFATFDASDDTLAERVAAVGAAITPWEAPDYRYPVAIFSFGGDAYVFISDKTAGLSGFDALVHLVGFPADPAHFLIVQDVIFGA